MNTSRNGLLIPVALCLLTFARAGIARAADAPPPSKPNILLIVSDDQGYADTGFNGCQDIPTPHLDRLAKSGVRFTSGYVTHAFCSPTRAALMTGRYQQRFGHEFNPVYDPLDPKEGLPLTEKLLPEFLQEAGYATGWIGKWHLGASPAHTPQARGFKDTFGFIGGGHQFWNWKPNERQYTLPIERNGRPVEVTHHLTTAFGDEAGAFVKRHTHEPWFLYLAFNAPHQPNQPTPERLARFAHLKTPNRATYAAQVNLMDDAIGRAMDAVRQSGQESRTLVFFFSDNGGPITKGAPNGAQNTPLRGGKGDLYEGGVRVPFVASWPGRLPSGKDYASPVSSLDVFTTALACAGVAVPTDRKYDGVDLVPFLTGEKNAAPHEHLFWRYGVDQQWAMREGDWKLVRLKDQPDELYDLAADIGEAQNLAAAKPEVAHRLAARLRAWDKELMAPVFLGSSVKNEDWGPGGANQQNRPKPQPQKDGAAAPAKPNLVLTLADAGSFPETGLPIFTNDNAARRHYRLPAQEPAPKHEANVAKTAPRLAAADKWRTLRVGLFIHWGPSSGKALPQSHSHARQSALNPHGSVPAEVYDQFYQEFNPTNYHPDAWLKLAHEAGMRYAVFVAKHHDGFCMFKTAATDYSIMATPYGKDVAAMFAAACQRQGMALGWQISPKDWKHPDFNTANHDRYNAYYEKLIDELSANYGALSVMWFDGIEPIGPGQWKETPARVARMLHDRHPNIMLGNHGGIAEDFLSFENMVAPFDRQQPWEMCEAINPSGWVFNKPMPPFPLRGLLRNLIYTVARDGNYLLDVGPMPDGQLYPPDAERLGEIAAWMKINAEGIHGTRGGPYRDGDWGGATCKGNAVYLFLADHVGERLTLPAPGAKIRSARRLDGGPLEWKAEKTSLRLHLAARAQNPRSIFVCVKLELDQPAFPLSLVDGQPNLAATARLTPSSVQGSATPQRLFDNDGDTAWETAPDDKANALDLDLGEPKLIGSLSLSERGQRVEWNHAYKLELKVRSDEHGEWQSILKHTGTLGGPPILDFKPVRARFVRLELGKLRPHPLQVSELRLFPPLEP